MVGEKRAMPQQAGFREHSGVDDIDEILSLSSLQTLYTSLVKNVRLQLLELAMATQTPENAEYVALRTLATAAENELIWNGFAFVMPQTADGGLY